MKDTFLQFQLTPPPHYYTHGAASQVPGVTHREDGSTRAGGSEDLCVGLKAYKKACIGGLSNSQPTGSESKLSITYSVCAL